MNAAKARTTAADVVNDLTDEDVGDVAEQTLLDDDGVVHLANAYEQIKHADASGVAASALYDSYDSVESVLRHRCADVLRDAEADAPNAAEVAFLADEMLREDGQEVA